MLSMIGYNSCVTQKLLMLFANRALEQFGNEKRKRSFRLCKLLGSLSLLPLCLAASDSPAWLGRYLGWHI